MSRERGLEFVVGAHRVVVLADAVERVVEAALSSRPPLVRPWIGGFGIHEGVVFAALDLTGDAWKSEKLETCVLLGEERAPQGKKADGAKVMRWGFRVTRTVDFVEVRPCARPSSAPAVWPSWVLGAELADGTVVSLLDVGRLTKDFAK